MPIKTYIGCEVDLSDAVEMLTDDTRVNWITALLETVKEEGTIDVIRELVNDPKWNDQK